MMWVFIGSILGSFGAVFLKMGATKLKLGFRHIVSVATFTGIVLYVISSVFYIAGLRHGELSVLYPMVSLGYVFALVWSRIFFKEPITTQKFAALGLIILGICLIGIGR